MTNDPVLDPLELKKSIREQAHANRKAQEDKDGLSQSICQKFAALPEFAKAKTVLVYLDVRTEVRTARRATGFRQTKELGEWIWDHQVAVFATDTFAVEVLPVDEDSEFRQSAPEDNGMMHQELIAKLGVVLGELWNLGELVEDSVRTDQWDAMCVIKPLNLVGGVGSPPNATALR